MASVCKGTCSVIGAFTEAGIMRLASLREEFLDLGWDSGRASTFFLGLLGPLFFAGDCEKDLDRAAGECTCNFLLDVSVTDSSNNVLGDFFVFSGQPV